METKQIPKEAQWFFKTFLTEEDGALKCHFCGKLVHIPGLKAHMDCVINHYVETLKKAK